MEAATLKIQSTFRGKKIRSKLGGGSASAAPPEAEKKTLEEGPKKLQAEQGVQSSRGDVEAASELSEKISEMQVNDKKEVYQQQVGSGLGSVSVAKFHSIPLARVGVSTKAS